jgi:hypothetical protein
MNTIGGASKVKLIDDGGATEVSVGFRDFRSPMIETVLSYEDAVEGISVSLPGGLFVARSPGQFAATTVAPPRKGLQLNQLSLAPSIAQPRKEPKEITSMLRAASDWEMARQKGSSLVPLFQHRVLEVFLAEIFGSICGERWARAEKRLLREPSEAAGVIKEMQSLVSDRFVERTFASSLEEDAKELTAASVAERVAQFERRLHRVGPTLGFGVVDVSRTGNSTETKRNISSSGIRRSICEFALRAASSPAAALDWGSVDVEDGIRMLIDRPMIARCARYLVLAVENRLDSPFDSSSTYRGWSW